MISPEAAALLTACCWSVNALLFSFAGHRVGSYTVNHIRLWFALFLVLLFLQFSGQLTFSFPAKGIFFMAISGMIGFSLGDAFLFEALVLLRVRDAMLIMLLSPVFSLFFGIFWFKERISVIEMAGVILTLSGIALVILFNNSENNSPVSLKGVFFALAGAVAQSVGLIFSKIGMSYGIKPMSANGIRLSAALLTMIVFTIIHKSFSTHFKKVVQDKIALLQIFAGALLGPFLGVFLALLAVSTGRIGISSILMSLAPVLLLPISVVFLQEKISFRAIFGTVMAFAGVSLIFIG